MSNARYVALGLGLLSLFAVSSADAGHRRRCCNTSHQCGCVAPAPSCCNTAAVPAAPATGTAANSNYQSYSYEPGSNPAPAAAGTVSMQPTANSSQTFYNRIRADRKSLGHY